MSISIDSEERKTIIESDQSFIVSAPAGSGKTQVLVARMLKKLLIVDDAKEIIAITFTKKAANEMQQRIIEWWNVKKEPYIKDIEKIIKKYKVEEEDLEIFVENLNIMTIDSLALRIIKNDITKSPLDIELNDDVDEIIEESLKDIIQEPEFEKDIQKITDTNKVIEIIIILFIYLILQYFLLYFRVVLFMNLYMTKEVVAQGMNTISL